MWSKGGRRQNLSEIFCARNFNKFGRYISLINVRGRRRSVIIILELTINSGWEFIAEKVGRFLLTQKMEENRIEQRLVDDKIPYAEALRSGKWINRSDSEVNVEPTLMVEGPIHIDDNISTISEVLKRSLVGFFEVRDENYPTLSEIKRWTSSIWKINHGLNIYEMGKGRFLFEFASRFTAEHVITGDWTRNETFLRLEWQEQYEKSAAGRAARAQMAAAAKQATNANQGEPVLKVLRVEV
uniref:DUF4283 domain-containing protein n=1 Tax=Solanum tuberosum TaxID=4113 RepID=M1BB33_SOLTU